MTDVQKKPRFWKGYWIAAAVLAGVTAAVLVWLWLFIDAFECSRPQTVMDSYLQTATPERISAMDGVVPAACDLALQEEAEVRRAIADSLQSITFLRDPKNSDADRNCYAIMNGAKRVGTVVLTAEEKDAFGFAQWKVQEEIYDFSHLLGEKVSVTVPDGYRVYANGILLDDSYVTQRDIHFEHLEPYYGRYAAPTMRTYTAGQVVGAPMITVTDQYGTAVDAGEEGELQYHYGNCSPEEIEALEKFAQAYITRYARFSSGWGGKGNRYNNYWNLSRYMVPDGELSLRMKAAIESMYWVADHRVKVMDVDYHQFIRMEQGVYMCDLTYTVNQRIRNGTAESSVNLRLVVVETAYGLRAEAMTIY